MVDVHDDTIEIEPRPVEVVAQRATVLVALLRRAALEEPAEAGDTDAFTRETDRFELFSWMRREGVGGLTEEERMLLMTSAGELDEASVDACLLAAIPARALAWALGAIDTLSPSDSLADADILLTWAPQPWDELNRWARKLSLRDEETLAGERERWELWHWRATLTPEDLEPGEDLPTVVAEVAAEAAGAGLAETIDRDLALAGRPVVDLSPDERDALAVLGEGYLHALNWVCGFGDRWDTTPLYPD